MDFSTLITLALLLATVLFTTQANESSTREKRIVGGARLSISRVPYQVALIWRNYVVCGGAIIAPLWILTAAHCLYRFQDLDIRIRAGSDRRNNGGIVRHMKWSIIHPQYSAKHVTNDVALILLNSPLLISSAVSCIKMVDQGYTPWVGQLGQVSGWGLTNPNSDATDPRSYSTLLLHTSLPVIDFGWCKNLYTKYILFHNVQFCAGYMKGRIDTCTGDSGGPFVIDRTLVGIISWGVSCAEPNHPGVFANVGAFRVWIDGIMHKYSRFGGIKCTHYF